jgi:hypothetical protein
VTADPRFAEPLARDPRSLDVWPTFLAAARTWTRLAAGQFLLFAAVVIPALVLLGLAAPGLSGLMLGATPEAIDPNELWGLGGVMLLGMSAGGLVSITAMLQADAALAGSPASGAGLALSEAVGRVPAAFASYLLLVLIVMTPYLVCFLPLLLLVPRDASGPSPGFVIGFVLSFLVAVPILVALGTLLRFGPILAAVRERGPVASLKDSFALVRGRVWRVLGYVVLVVVAVQAAMTAAISLAVLAFPVHPVAACFVYALGLAVTLPFQFVQEVALLRRLEAMREGPAPTP